MIKKGRKSSIPDLIFKIYKLASLPGTPKKYRFTKDQIVYLSVYVDELNRANTELKAQITQLLK